MSDFNILIAEDELLLQKNLENKITALNLGFKIAGTAQNGVQALEKLDKLQPDVLFTDIKMPQMDGIELINKVSKAYPFVKIVVISGYAEFEYARQAMQCGVFNYLLKPVKSFELEDALIAIKSALCHERNITNHDTQSASANAIANALMQEFSVNFANEIDLSAYAREFGVSQAYISKVFSKSFGESPLKYLTQIRINKAKHLLLHSDLQIKAVGEAVGYHDQFYFSKLFKQATGKSPAQFRSELV